MADLKEAETRKMKKALYAHLHDSSPSSSEFMLLL